ncbi:MAG: hypothetical protein KJ731_21180 [Alphaproteobacteria bacterium]|uniref:DNA-binding transcriptional repressor CapW winged helix-turn-helix domain-containing protein n=1 Tax=viral metagenome TaxID=1070528 RepID=A0A6M3JIX2_9ZZZZ|nr:hypothetical protein [Alphaproteobacteria bacterium]MBU1280299.1 hypothetical protein [Alphaproteobacteria bacterium]MBU1573037.1 hypothetical protein [Alphaproteobacteria bacterium]MBU1830964.1 hypothetical protein [Alphaproteobacteria bacterium]MBU2079997.1 hypothetical protein [Alphaproteobacteria bacterium]
MNFAQRMRLIWIDSQLECGPLNRSDIMCAFEISTAQAAVDLKAYRTEHPSRIKYEPREKHYRRPPKAKPAYPQHLRLLVRNAVMSMQIYEDATHV